MLHFWDPYYCCFTFRSIKLTPTTEEYAELLRPNIQSPISVYLPNLNDNPQRHLANLLDLKAKEITQTFTKNEKQQPVMLNYLLGHIERCQQWDRVELKLKVLMLAIYEIVVFPFGARLINDRVIIFYDRMNKENFNPALAMLEDTFHSLSYCQRTKKSFLRCCASILHVCFISHINQ